MQVLCRAGARRAHARLMVRAQRALGGAWRSAQAAPLLLLLLRQPLLPLRATVPPARALIPLVPGLQGLDVAMLRDIGAPSVSVLPVHQTSEE